MNYHKTPHRATKGIDPIKNPEDRISAIRDMFYAVSFFTNFKKKSEKNYRFMIYNVPGKLFRIMQHSTVCMHPDPFPWGPILIFYIFFLK